MISLFEVGVFVTKTSIVLIYVTALYRLLGKRFVAQLNVYDLVTVVALSNAVQNAMTEGRGDLAVGLVSAGTLIGIGYLLSKVYIKAPRLQGVVNGIPTLLAYEGKAFEDRMKKEHVSDEELSAALHAHGMNDVSEIGMAVLEPDGSISIVPKGRSCKFDSQLAGSQ